MASIVPLSPSVTVTLLMASEGNGSSLRMVPTAWPSVRVALTTPDRFMKKVSSVSLSRSPFTRTGMV